MLRDETSKTNMQRLNPVLLSFRFFSPPTQVNRIVRYSDASYNVTHYWSQWGNSLFTLPSLEGVGMGGGVRGQMFIGAPSLPGNQLLCCSKKPQHN